MSRFARIPALVAASLLVVFAWAATGSPPDRATDPLPASADALSGPDEMLRPEEAADTDWVARAEALAQQGRLAEAEDLLLQGVEGMPAGWRPIVEENDTIRAAFWDTPEFLAFVGTQPRKSVRWMGPSYSKAFYLLAVMGIQTGDPERALKYLARASELEGDHPLVVHETALVLRQSGRAVDALQVLDAPRSTPTWLMSRSRQALLERDRGVTLVELGMLDEAEAALRRSLKLEPGSTVAHHELRYIGELRVRGEAAKEGLELTPLRAPKPAGTAGAAPGLPQAGPGGR